MNKKIKIISLCVFVFLLIPINIKAKETPTIIYDGAKQTFKIKNIHANDLFTDLKDLMPGDSIKQDVKFQLINIKQPTVFYLEASSDENLDAYDQLFVKIFNGTELISEKGVFDALKLGEFSSDQTLDLSLTLDISTEAEYSNDEINLKWAVVAEERGKQVSYELIDTSDKSFGEKNYLFLLSLVTVAAVLLLAKIKLNYNENKRK